MNPLPLRLVLDPVGDELAAALACEAEVFLDAYGNTPDELAREYGPYRDATGFLAVLDECGRALASSRFIVPGPAGLKTLDDVGRPPWGVDGERSARAAGLDLARTWDVTTIAVRRTARGSLCSAALYHGIVTAAAANGADYVVMVMDARARRLLSALGMQTNVLPGTGERPYLGSARSTPLWAHLPTMSDLQQRHDPDAHRLVFKGTGLDGIALPSDWTRGARPAPAPRRPGRRRPLVASLAE